MEKGSMEEWEIVDYLEEDGYGYESDDVEEKYSKLGWLINVGKKVVMTGFVISSAPLVLPPLFVVSALGFAFSVPFGVLFASYACTQKIMTKLLPLPPLLILDDDDDDDDDMLTVEPHEVDHDTDREKEEKEIELLVADDKYNNDDEQESLDRHIEFTDNDFMINNIVEEEVAVAVAVAVAGTTAAVVVGESDDIIDGVVVVASEFKTNTGQQGKCDQGEEINEENKFQSAESQITRDDNILDVVENKNENVEKVFTTITTTTNNNNVEIEVVDGRPAAAASEGKNSSSEGTSSNKKRGRKKSLAAALRFPGKRKQADKIGHTEELVVDDDETHTASCKNNLNLRLGSAAGDKLVMTSEKKQGAAAECIRLISDSEDLVENKGVPVKNNHQLLLINDDVGQGYIVEKQVGGALNMVPAGEEEEEDCSGLRILVADDGDHELKREEEEEEEDVRHLQEGKNDEEELEMEMEMEMGDEKMIWEKIDAIRAIVGFQAPRHVSSFEELKALYLFTGIELPPMSSDHFAEFHNNLCFLMSVIGLKY